jgi:hypothetical protein
MIPKRLAKLMEIDLDAARSVIEDEGARIANHFVAENSEIINYLMTPWPSDAARAWTLKELRTFFREHKIERYVHTSEALRSTRYKNQPSRNPVWKEVLVIAGIERTPRTICLWQFVIERLPDGKRKLGEKTEILEGMKGDTFRLFDSDSSLN